MIGIVYWSTIFDFLFLYFKAYRNQRVTKFLRIFSANFNTHQLMQYDSNNSESNRLEVVDEIRYMWALTTAMIHSYACATDYRVMPKIARIEAEYKSKFSIFWLQPFFNTVAIEAFFCIG